jgi:hypothetical protein
MSRPYFVPISDHLEDNDVRTGRVGCQLPNRAEANGQARAILPSDNGN